MPTPRADPKQPRYLQLADDLRARILSGDLPPAGPFPTESILCARYDVSRFTVREALRMLKDEGLIQRRRGSGTLIQAAAIRGGALHQPLSNVAEIFQYARDTRFAFRREGSVVLPARLGEEVGCRDVGRWARFRGIRTRVSQGRPIAVTDAYVHPALADAADRIDLAGETIFNQLQLLAAVPIVRVTQDIRAVAATAAIARTLGVTRGSPCLRVLRCYIDETDRMIEISASHHPGDRFAYAMHMEIER